MFSLAIAIRPYDEEVGVSGFILKISLDLLHVLRVSHYCQRGWQKQTHPLNFGDDLGIEQCERVAGAPFPMIVVKVLQKLSC
jgi:hypothetical protein